MTEYFYDQNDLFVDVVYFYRLGSINNIGQWKDKYQGIYASAVNISDCKVSLSYCTQTGINIDVKM